MKVSVGTPGSDQTAYVAINTARFGCCSFVLLLKTVRGYWSMTMLRNVLLLCRAYCVFVNYGVLLLCFVLCFVLCSGNKAPRTVSSSANLGIFPKLCLFVLLPLCFVFVSLCLLVRNRFIFDCA